MIYLVRHGQSRWNLERRSQGQADAPGLTELGRAQAAAAATAIGLDLDAEPDPIVRTSDLTRATDTAEIVAAAFGLTVQVDPRLRERSLGRLDGLGYDETHAAVAELDWTDPDLRIGGGESSRELYHRTAEVLAEYRARQRPVLVVSHGDLIRAALALHAGLAVGEDFWADVPNGSVAVLDGSAPVRRLTIPIAARDSP